MNTAENHVLHVPIQRSHQSTIDFLGYLFAEHLESEGVFYLELVEGSIDDGSVLP